MLIDKIKNLNDLIAAAHLCAEHELNEREAVLSKCGINCSKELREFMIRERAQELLRANYEWIFEKPTTSH